MNAPVANITLATQRFVDNSDDTITDTSTGLMWSKATITEGDVTHATATEVCALFDTLAALKDKEKPMDLDRARAICDVSQTIINSAKVEVDFMKATGAQVASGFIAIEPPKPRLGYRLVESAVGSAAPTPAAKTKQLIGAI